MKLSYFDQEIARLERYLAESEPVFNEYARLVYQREACRERLSRLRALRLQALDQTPIPSAEGKMNC